MDDLIHYKIPMGFIGDMANSLFIRNQIHEIFEYRFKVLEEQFGKF
jgi:ligand-binding SRPBCC domain-containing protein